MNGTRTRAGRGVGDGPRGAGPTVAVLLSNYDDAHQRKFVRAFRRLGYATTVLAFARDDYYRADAGFGEDRTVLGVLGNESYVTRVPVYVRSLRRIRAELTGADVILVFSSEHALLVRAATALHRPSPLIVREIADVPRTVDDEGWMAGLARAIERWGLRRSAAVIVTADGFESEYLRARMRYEGPVAVLPNKPDLPRGPAPGWVAPAAGRPVEILYAGLIRCRRSLEILRAVALEAPDGFSISVWGHNLTGLEIGELGNFRFLGPYRSPEDLGRLYGGCHVVYSGYPYEPARTNYSLARTNRFYETVVFGRPQIAHEGTADAVAVRREELGIVIDPSDIGVAVRRITSTPREAWARYAEGARRLAAEWSTYDDDFAATIAELRERLRWD